jgi:predicted ATP-binding protein involved in virulence
VVLIDEIELHLHPSWQRRVLGDLTRTFPNCQFIVTTHSPQVLSEVPNEAVIVVKDFQCYRPAAPTEGRDANAILSEVFDVPARPAATVAELDAISDLLDSRRYEEAHARLDRLAAKITERDPEVQGFRTTLDVVERLDAAPPQEPSE